MSPCLGVESHFFWLAGWSPISRGCPTVDLGCYRPKIALKSRQQMPTLSLARVTPETDPIARTAIRKHMLSSGIGQEGKYGKFHAMQRNAKQHSSGCMSGRETWRVRKLSPLAGGLVVEYNKPWRPDEGLDGHRPESNNQGFQTAASSFKCGQMPRGAFSP